MHNYYSTVNKGWSVINYHQSLAFDRSYLSFNDHCDWWLFQEIFFIIIFRSSHTQMVFKTSVTRNFAIFTGKHLCWSLFLKFNLVPKETSTQLFSCEYCKVFMNRFFYRTPLVAALVSLIK